MKPSYLRFCFAIIGLSLCIAPAAHARPIQRFTFDELFEKSDLIVIAQPTIKTTDTPETTYFSDIFQMDTSGINHKIPAIGVETTFNVIKVLKGSADIKQFVLHHYRVAAPSSLPNGPGTASFDSKRYEDVLLFLVRENDGRYAPYGGQTDPSFVSIFALDPPR